MKIDFKHLLISRQTNYTNCGCYSKLKMEDDTQMHKFTHKYKAYVICDIMAFTLWTLYEATLLVLNAVCILHEERFLVKYGWGANQNIQGFGEPPSIKSQILNLIRSIRTVVRIPLIFFNIVTIIIKLILG